VNDDQVLDESRLRALSGGSASVETMLLDSLVDEAADLLERLEAAAVVKDRGTLREAAHALKGIAGNVGAAQLERRARALEDALRVDAPTVTAELVAIVEALAAIRLVRDRRTT